MGYIPAAFLNDTVCHDGWHSCCLSKRRRRTLLCTCSFLSSAEKRSGTVLKQPHYGTIYLHFQNSTVSLQPFPANFLNCRPSLCNLACTGQPPISRLCTCNSEQSKGNDFCTSSVPAVEEDTGGASSSSKGWDCFPKTDGGDEKMWGWSSACIYNRQLCNVRGKEKKKGETERVNTGRKKEGGETERVEIERERRRKKGGGNRELT